MKISLIFTKDFQGSPVLFSEATILLGLVFSFRGSPCKYLYICYFYMKMINFTFFSSLYFHIIINLETRICMQNIEVIFL